MNRKGIMVIIWMLFVFFLCGSAVAEPGRPAVTAGKAVPYLCGNGDRVIATYYDLSDGSLPFVKVRLPEGRVYTLPRALSASGSRYTDDIELVWWIKGDTAFAESRGASGDWQPKYRNCRVAENDPDSLDDILRPYLSRYGLPAISAAVVKDGKVVASGAVGTRRAGADIPVSLDDRFHIGSDTKAFTALLAAMLVEEGRLKWTTTPAEVFPELAAGMHPDFRRVTLEQLLSHTSGLPSDNEDIFNLYRDAMFQEGNLDELRYALVREAGKRALPSPPGKVFAYSNLGYTVAGAMIERTAGKTWDELIVERIFTPLELATAGLGPQASLGRVDAPLGHVVVDGKTKAMLAGPNGDVPALIGPAGIGHMSILDFARWAGWNAGEGKRPPALVKPGTLRKLHTPVVSMPEKKDAAPGTPSKGRYALGWGEMPMEWATEPLIYHGGSNSMNLAHIWIDPRRDFAMVTATNIGGPKSNDALYSLARELYGRFAERQGK
jgi:CubicO group peptidase (beta-lactamase class C family)